MKTNLLPGLLVLLVLSSCGTAYFAPTAQNVPLFKDKNEFRVLGALSTGDLVEGKELQAAWSPVKYLGATGSYYELAKNIRGHGSYYEVGIGGYYPYKKFVVELYGGYGNGKTLNEMDDDFIRTNFRRFYLQPAVGFSNRYFDIAFSAKYSTVRQYGISSSPVDSLSRPEVGNDLILLNSNLNHIFIEPAITFRVGWKYVKLHVQYCFIPGVNAPNYPVDHSNLNAGLFISIPHIPKQKKQAD